MASVSHHVNPGVVDHGIKFVLGMTKAGYQGASEVQSVMFDSAAWTIDAARHWLKEHGFKSHKADKTKGQIRFRQQSPKRFKVFRTILPGQHNPIFGPRFQARDVTPASGGVAHHMQRAPASAAVESGGLRSEGTYKGYRIWKTDTGEYISSMDPESHYSTLKQVRKSVDEFGRRGNPEPAAEPDISITDSEIPVFRAGEEGYPGIEYVTAYPELSQALAYAQAVKGAHPDVAVVCLEEAKEKTPGGDYAVAVDANQLRVIEAEQVMYAEGGVELIENPKRFRYVYRVEATGAQPTGLTPDGKYSVGTFGVKLTEKQAENYNRQLEQDGSQARLVKMWGAIDQELYGESRNPPRTRYLLITQHLSETPPRESYTGKTTEGPFRPMMKGTPVKILERGKGGHRFLVEADYYGSPYWGWVNEEYLGLKSPLEEENPRRRSGDDEPFPYGRVEHFKPRFVPESMLAELSNLWHLSRVPKGNDRYQRLLWTSNEFSKLHPEISSTAAYKDLDDMLRFGGHNPASKDPAVMTAGEINKALDKLDAEDSRLTQAMIDAGRGHERPSDYLHKTDPLSVAQNDVYRKRQSLRIEIEMRYGPGAPSRLPKGFGPRHRNPSTPPADWPWPGQWEPDLTEDEHLFGWSIGHTPSKYAEPTRSAGIRKIREIMARDPERTAKVIRERRIARGDISENPTFAPTAQNDYGPYSKPQFIRHAKAIGYPMWTRYGEQKKSLSEHFPFHEKAGKKYEYYIRVGGDIAAAAVGGFQYLDDDVNDRVNLLRKGKYIPVLSGHNPRHDWDKFLPITDPVEAGRRLGHMVNSISLAPDREYFLRFVRAWAKANGQSKADAEAQISTGFREVYKPRRNPLPVMTYELAMAAARDAGNRHMKKAGRTVWSKADYNAAVKEFNRIYPDPTKGKRKNPEDAASDLYEQFHGRPPDHFITIEEQLHEHEWYAQLGPLVELKVATLTNLEATITLNPKKRPHLASNEDGTQLFFVGGDQELDLKAMKMNGEEWVKESMVIGVLFELTYESEKGFDKFKLTDYYHNLGEETGVQPMLIYDSVNCKISVSGGQYRIKPEGIVN